MDEEGPQSGGSGDFHSADQHPSQDGAWAVGAAKDDADAEDVNVDVTREAVPKTAEAGPVPPEEPRPELNDTSTGHARRDDPLNAVLPPIAPDGTGTSDDPINTTPPPVNVSHQQLVDMLNARYRGSVHGSIISDETPLTLYDTGHTVGQEAAKLAFVEAVRHVTAVAHGTTAVSNTPPSAAALLARIVGISDTRAQEILLMRAPGPINIDLLTHNEPGVEPAVAAEYQRILAQPTEARDGWALLLYVLESVAAGDAAARGGTVCDVGPSGAGPAVQDGHASERAALVLATLAFRDSKWSAWATALVMGAPLEAQQSPTPVGYLAHSFRVARAFASDAAFERVTTLRTKINALVDTEYNKTQLYQIQACAALNTVMCCHAELVLACQRAPLCAKSSSTALPDTSRDDILGSALYAHAARLRLAGYSIKPILDLMSQVQVVRARLASMYVELPPSAPDALLYGLHVLGAMRIAAADKGSASLTGLFVAAACAHFADRPRDGFVTCGISRADNISAGNFERRAASKDRAAIEYEVHESSAAVSAATQALVERGVPARDAKERAKRVQALHEAVMMLYERSIEAAAVYAAADRTGPHAQYMESLRARDTGFRPILQRRMDEGPRVYDTNTLVQFRDSFGQRNIGTIASHDRANGELIYHLHVQDATGTRLEEVPARDVSPVTRQQTAPWQAYAAMSV